MIEPKFDSIPDELKSIDSWVVWRLENGKKKPFSPTTKRAARTDDPSTWGTFAQAEQAFHDGFDGVGIVLTGSGLVAIDIDDCINDRRLADDGVDEVMKRLECDYVELSPSGKGLRGFGFSDAQPTLSNGYVDGVRIEVYADRQYLTVTGHRVNNWGAGSICEIPGFKELLEKMSHPTEESRRGTEEDTRELRRSEGEHNEGAFQSFAFQRVPAFLLPKRHGERHRKIFDFARWVKGQYPDTEAQDLRPLFIEWHNHALPFIQTKSFSVSWEDFVDGFGRVKYVPGDTMAAVLEDCDLQAELSDSLKRLGYNEHDAELLNACRALAAHHEPDPFFLGAREAAKLLGHSDHSTAAGMLRGFVRDGVLEVVDAGSFRKGKVTRYHWIWPD